MLIDSFLPSYVRKMALIFFFPCGHSLNLALQFFNEVFYSINIRLSTKGVESLINPIIVHFTPKSRTLFFVISPEGNSISTHVTIDYGSSSILDNYAEPCLMRTLLNHRCV